MSIIVPVISQGFFTTAACSTLIVSVFPESDCLRVIVPEREEVLVLAEAVIK